MRYPNSESGVRKGVVLLAVLVVVVLLTLAAYEFSELTVAESRAANANARAAQARAFAESGIQFAAAALGNPTILEGTLQGNPFNNPAAFQDVIVCPNSNPYLQGRFSLMGQPSPDQAFLNGVSQSPYTFGVNDEAARINVNSIMQLDSSGQTLQNMLLQFPNMTQTQQNSIVDWMDADEQPLPSGGESDFYSSLNPSYNSKDGPLDSLEELLLVQGFSPQLFLGNDRNRNSQLDPGEDDGTGMLNPGWMSYLTVYTRELNIASNGNQRIYVNDNNLQTLFQNLQSAVGNDMAVYILAYRLYGGSAAGANSTAPTSGFSASALGNLTSPSSSPRSISSLYSLINTQVTIPSTGQGARPTVYACPLNNQGTMQQLLPQLIDQATTNKNAVMLGRININTAPQTVLMGLPNLQASDVQNIIQNQPTAPNITASDPTYLTTAWLITQANMTPAQVAALDPYITARSSVFRVQSVGYFDKGGPTARIEAVIDTNGPRPRIVYWRDLTELGKAYSLPAGNGQQP